MIWYEIYIYIGFPEYSIKYLYTMYCIQLPWGPICINIQSRCPEIVIFSSMSGSWGSAGDSGCGKMASTVSIATAIKDGRGGGVSAINQSGRSSGFRRQVAARPGQLPPIDRPHLPAKFEQRKTSALDLQRALSRMELISRSLMILFLGYFYQLK